MEIDNIATFECPKCRDFKATEYYELWCPLCNQKRYIDWITYITRRCTIATGVYISEVNEEGKLRTRKL